MSMSNVALNQSPGHQPDTSQAKHDVKTEVNEKKVDKTVNTPGTPQKKTRFKPPVRVTPKSPRLLTSTFTATNVQPKTSLDAPAMPSTPPKLVVQDGQQGVSGQPSSQQGVLAQPASQQGDLASGGTDAELSRIRSSSSPAKLSSPPLKPTPLSPTRQPLVPPLKLHLIGQPLTAHTIFSPVTPTNTALNSPSSRQTNGPTHSANHIPIPSPTKFKSPRGSRRVKMSDSKPMSTSAPTSPTQSSKTAPEVQFPATRRSIKSPGKNLHTDIHPMPSPRKLDTELMSLADEVVGHCIRAMLGNTADPDAKSGANRSEKQVAGDKLIRESDGKTLLRQDLVIPVDQLSPAIRARLPRSFNQATISHSALINALYGQSFAASPAGKALSATRKSVMDDYSNSALTLAELAAREQSDPDIRKRYQQNMDDRTAEYANFAFGSGARRSPGNIISAELLQLWRTMDGQASALNLSRAERERLAFDLILTRMVLRSAKGDDSEAILAIPSLFFNSVKQASKQIFPDFVGAVLDMFEHERRAPSRTAAIGVDHVSSSSSSTNGSSSSSTSGRSSSSSTNRSGDTPSNE